MPTRMQSSETEEVPLIRFPWVDLIVPALSTPHADVCPTETTPVLRRLQIGLDPVEDCLAEASQSVSFETQESCHIDKLELERRATGCRVSHFQYDTPFNASGLTE
eukprot:Gregarina_sp_Poly_1__3019@NODE_1849_length_3212_cov_7_286169_g1200_i0_p5_GENE_NODE_1849_length_3212_cov_7_286169_g1200_i0NODE_1849_length_3212_cov_7_286169_g1200_i0_p5_ORF_typecomplete_len106_score19_03_NODE_1849_length_3212_cov_7_286169_g1200_i020032320